MEKKKKILLIILYSVVILGTILIIVYAHNKNLNQNKNKDKNKQISIYESSNKRDEIIKDFEDHKIISKKNNNEECGEDAGGNRNVVLQNNKELLKYFKINELVDIEKDIIESTKNINNAITEKAKIESYYAANKNILLQNYGIENLKEYEMFINKMEDFKSNKITFCKVQENSIHKKDNYIAFNLELGNENKKKIVLIRINDKEDYSLKWIVR